MTITARTTYLSVTVGGDFVEGDRLIKIYEGKVEIGQIKDHFVINPDDDITGRRDAAARHARVLRAWLHKTLKTTEE